MRDKPKGGEDKRRLWGWAKSNNALQCHQIPTAKLIGEMENRTLKFGNIPLFFSSVSTTAPL